MAPYLLIFLAAVLWGFLGVFTALLFDAGLGAMEIAFWPALIGGGLFVVHALVGRQVTLRRRRDIPIFVVFGLIGVTLFFAAFNFTVKAGGISLAVILLYTAPAFVVVLARLFLNEDLTVVKLAAVALVIAGVSLIAVGGPGANVTMSTAAVSWGLVAALSYALVYIVGKRLLVHYRPVTIYAYILPVGTVGLFPFVEFGHKDPIDWTILVIMGVVCTYGAYLLYYLGLRRAEASRAILVASTEPVVAAGLAALFFGERLGMAGIAGAGLVLAASWIGIFWRRPEPD